MWEQLKKEVMGLFSGLNVFKYFRSFEDRLYDIELQLYKMRLTETIDQIIQAQSIQESHGEFIQRETPVALDREYEKDFSCIRTSLEAKYKNSDKIAISMDYTSLIVIHKAAPVAAAKKATRKRAPGRKAKAIAVSILILSSLLYCTDAKIKQWTTLGNPGRIHCYSGGELIYDGESTGKIATEQGSDGWYFEERGSGNLIRVSGDCVIRN